MAVRKREWEGKIEWNFHRGRLDFRRSLMPGLPSPRRTAVRVSGKACLRHKFIIKILAALLVVRNVI